MPGSLAEGVSPAAMLVGDRGPRRWESWTVGRSDWWWVCTDEGRLRCATLSLLSWLSVLVGFGRGPECLKNFTRGSATAATDPYTRAAAVEYRADELVWAGLMTGLRGPVLRFMRIDAQSERLLSPPAVGRNAHDLKTCGERIS